MGRDSVLVLILPEGHLALNLRQQAEVAALVSAHSAHLIESTFTLPEAALRGFWNQHRQRLQFWLRGLNRSAGCAGDETPAQRAALWKQTETIVEEVFVSEMLNRVWSAILTAADRRRRTVYAGPLAAAVLLGQMKARQLAIATLVNGSHHSLDQVARLDRLRRRTERWTDLLLGHLVTRYGVADFAFDEQRARDFGDEQLRESVRDPGNRVWELILTGLRLAFPKTKSDDQQLSDHGGEIVRWVLSTFPAEAFAAEGPFKPILHGRISRSGTHPERSPHAPLRKRGTVASQLPSSAPPTKAISFAKLRRRLGPEL